MCVISRKGFCAIAQQWSIKQAVLIFLIPFFAVIFCQKSYAYHPITKQVDLLGVYPKWPTVDYGTGKEAKLIKRGEYLAKVGDCLACHTNTSGGGKPFGGGLAINTPFGTFYTPNISPDKQHGIGKWTEKDFIRAMHDGKNPQGKNYFPVFPYLYFTRISKDDLRAMWAYMKRVPAVNQKDRSQPFPFNVPGARFGLYGWNAMFFYGRKGYYKYDASQSKEWNRGAYLVQGLGHCSMCHTPLNFLGAPKDKYYLTGGFIDGYWAPNITSYGLKTASRYEVAQVFVEGKLINKAGTVAGPMAEVNHDSLQYLSLPDRLAIATYLKSTKSIEPLGVKASEKQPTIKRGKQVYASACVICHLNGEAGAPPIGNKANWELRVQQGLPVLYRHAINGYNNMPVKGACVTCSDNDIKAAVDYLVYKSLSLSQLAELKNPKKQPKHSIESGKAIYASYCGVCHTDGKLGAPKTGDKAVWAPLIRKNMDVLILNTINGYNSMPAKGGCKHCTNSEIIAAVKYMVEQSKTGGDYTLW